MQITTTIAALTLHICHLHMIIRWLYTLSTAEITFYVIFHCLPINIITFFFLC